jgi:protein gp37
MGDTKIEWTDKVWNPLSGCTKVSQGCKNCFAERLFPRVYGRDVVIANQCIEVVPFTVRHRKFTDVKLHADRLEQPLHWRKPRMIFVNSMSDLFHEDVPDEFIDRVFAVMALASRHVFQVLTKRPERMLGYMVSRSKSAQYWKGAVRGFGYSLEYEGISLVRFPLPNVWLGVSVEDQETANERIPLLLQTPAAVRWVSAEPLLGPVDFRAITVDYEEMRGYTRRIFRDALQNHECWGQDRGLQWIVAGSESGPKARPTELDWFRSIREQCVSAKVPFFFKQHVENKKKIPTPELDGVKWTQYPAQS